MWALGVLVHELLTLERPFIGRNMAELINKIKAGIVPPYALGSVSIPMAAMIRQLLHQTPEKRPSATKLLDQDMIRYYRAMLLKYVVFHGLRETEEQILRHIQAQRSRQA